MSFSQCVSSARSLKLSLSCLAVQILFTFHTPAAPVMRAVNPSNSGSELLRNGDFEQVSGTKALGWQPAPQSYQLASTQGRQDSKALMCSNRDDQAWSGASQTLTLNRTEIAPLV